MTCAGNLVTAALFNTTNGALLNASSNLESPDVLLVKNNLLVPDNNGRSSITVSASILNVANVLITGCLGRNDGGTTGGALFSNVDPAVFTRGHGAVDNLFIGGTASTVSFNNSMNEIAGEGSANMGGQIGLCTVAPGP